MNINELIQQSRFTVLIGKNGAGKSSLLRTLTTGVNQNIKYVSPERGGTLKYDPNVDNNITNAADWMRQTRQANRFEQFRQQSAAQFRSLETSVLREIEKDPVKRASNETFDTILAQINNLLPAVKLVRVKAGFAVRNKADEPLDEGHLSSGESELIALAIEVLVFSRQTEANKVLLLDEPDVHLHPDLQQKFIAFVVTVAVERDVRIVIATHSTAVIGAFPKSADLQIVPIENRNQVDFAFFKKTEVAESVLPIFGAHPLSTAFNKMPAVLVEGDDDRRVLEQVVRSGSGRFALSPCVVGTVSELAEWEEWLNKFLPVLYDSPKAFSLRDLDDATLPEINDLSYVVRMRLNCYAMENLLVCDEVLKERGFDEDSFRGALQDWATNSKAHEYGSAVQTLVDGFEARRTLNIKDVRNIVVAVLGIKKPWEVLLGQIIATKVSTPSEAPNSLRTYLGPKVVANLFS